MMNSSENIDRYFKEKLENYKENPPQDTWNKIADQLGHSRKRRMVVFISRIAAGITILISMSVLFHYMQKDKTVELAQQSDSITQLHPGDVDNISTRTAESKTSPSENEMAESVIAGKTVQKRSAHSEMTGSHSVEQTNQSPYVSEDDVLQKGSEVKYMASANTPVPDEISYLIPIDCNHLGDDISASDQLPAEQDFLNSEQAREPSNDQLLALMDDQPEEKDRQTEWLIGGQFAPLYSYRNLASDQYQDYVKDQINSKESGIIAYAGGINVTVSPNKRLSVQGGIYYSKYGQEKNSFEYAAFMLPLFQNPDKDIAASAYNGVKVEEQPLSVFIGNSTGKIVGSEEGLVNFNRSPSEPLYTEESNQLNSSLPIKSITQYFEYLEVPINIKYKVLDKRFDVSLLGGISTNFLVGTDIQLNYTDNSSKNTDYTTEGLNRINYSGLIGIGFEYPLLKNLIFNVEPKFRYYMNPIDKEQVYDIHPYSIGVFSGISYVF